jgi:thiamine-monophosphate kinase
MSRDELAFISWIKKQTKRDKSIMIGIDDDACYVNLGSKKVLFKVDNLVEGVHFTKDIEPEKIGSKAISRVLSDIAAMGSYPRFCLIAINMPLKASFIYAKEIFKGIKKVADQFDVKIVGGETIIHNGPLAISVFIAAVTNGLNPVRRDGAIPDDLVLVTGKLGGSILSKHLDFKPRIKEAIFLNKNFKINSMIDISDGLVLDLSRICNASNVGAIIDEDKIPVSKDAIKLSRRDKIAPMEHALYDGEDYELLFTCNKEIASKILTRSGLAIQIGRITPSKGIFLRLRDGQLKRLKIEGWRYLFKR